MGRDKVVLFAEIRADHRAGMGVRAIGRKYGVHRRTVREALASPVPAPRKAPERASPARDAVAPLIDVMLREDLDAPRKQRHTARRVWARLADEHDEHPSYSYVARYVSRRRPEIGAERKGAAGSLEGFVPQAKEPGAEAEVDFGPVTVELGGMPAACHLFAYRLSFSGMGVHRPVDRTNGPFLVDPPRPGPLMGQASSSSITRMEAGWIRTRGPGSAMRRGWLFPGSGRCAQPVIRCCHGWWPMSSASGSTRSMTS